MLSFAKTRALVEAIGASSPGGLVDASEQAKNRHLMLPGGLVDASEQAKNRLRGRSPGPGLIARWFPRPIPRARPVVNAAP